ncbi:DUF3829 domain-containing protein [Paenibacillus motobuensis]|uniref:DUF3829 domain-containing protein n=1 Tax=Paenibacillus motobuensis TaxID=295324 RepID=A0ABN0XV76_9BACL
MRSMRVRWNIIVSLSLLALLLSSCRLPLEKSKITLSGGSEQAVSAQENSGAEATVRKYAGYIALDIYIHGQVADVLERYGERFGHKETLDLQKEAHLDRGVNLELTEANKLAEYMELTDKQPALPEVDDAVTKLAPTLEGLVKTLGEIDTYYRFRFYVDDDLAKGKTLHEQLQVLLEEWEPLVEGFTVGLHQSLMKQRELDLADFKANNQMIRYHALKSIMAAEAIEDELTRQSVTTETLDRLDIAAYRGLYDRLTEEVAGYIAAAEDPEQVKQEELDSNNLYGYMLKQKIMLVKASATDLLQRAEQSRTFSDYNKDGTPKDYKKKLQEAVLEYYVFVIGSE